VEPGREATPSLSAPEPLISATAVRDALLGLAAGTDPADPGCRERVLAHLKGVLAEGREAARRVLEGRRRGGGRAAAEALSSATDALLAGLFDFACLRLAGAPEGARPRLSLVAVGGYGRGALAPGSDIDLLFLFPQKPGAWSERVTEYILYLLWDLGLKVGHGTRSVAEALRMAKDDMTVRTATLEARLIAGDPGLFQELETRFRKEVVAGTAKEFIAAKLAERNARHAAVGRTRYLVEPNVKDGKGGLRDLQTLYWIGRYCYCGTSAGDALVEAGLLSPREHRLFRRCEDFLWTVRCHLHFMTGRAEERVSFEVQPELARRLGYQKHPGLEAVERFMKHYFLIAKDVGDLTRVVCAALEEREAKNVPTLNRLLRALSPRGRSKLAGTKDFVIDHHRITVADEGVFERDPVNLIRFFHKAGQANLALHPDAVRLVTRSLGLIDDKLRNDPQANRLFLDILTSRTQNEVLLRAMNETGVLGRFIPDFGHIVAMMQFSMYHHYTVDEHTIRALGLLAEMESGKLADDHPLAARLLPELRDRTALYVALFLHDIGKGKPADHSQAGSQVARRLCPRLGLSERETELVAWLVAEHLTMSQMAQSRDLADRRTIVDFAERVQSVERLKLLLILTVADIRAVGPGVWTGWKGQLLRTLYYETETYLSGGHAAAAAATRVAEARERLGNRLASLDPALSARILDLHYPAYYLRVEEDAQVRQALLIARAETEADPTGVTTEIQPRAFEGVTEITVLCRDHPRLVSLFAGACAAAGASIVHAQIHTTTDGRALDAFSIGRSFDTDEDEMRRGRRIVALFEQALSGRVRLIEAMAERRRLSPRRDPFQVPADVTVNNDLSDRFTVIEVTCRDRTGLLYDLTRAIGELSLDIASAQIATYGEKAIDTFYVRDLTSQKIVDEGRKARIVRALQGAIEGGSVARALEARGL